MDKFIMPFRTMDVNLNFIKLKSYCMAENFNFCGITNLYECFRFLYICYNKLYIVKNKPNDAMDDVLFYAATLWQKGRICEIGKV
jgi:hypothetical protein